MCATTLFQLAEMRTFSFAKAKTPPVIKKDIGCGQIATTHRLVSL